MMNFELWDLKAFLAGALSGFICVSGLYFGVRALMSSVGGDPALSPPKKRRLRFWGTLIVIAQFVGAFGVLGAYLSNAQERAVIPLAFGLILSIFIGNMFYATLRK